MVKSVNIDKNGMVKLEITMDYIIYQAARGLLTSEINSEDGKYFEYRGKNFIIGEGFEILLKLGIANLINNKGMLNENLEKAVLTILDNYPEIAKNEIEIIKNREDDVEGRPSKSDRDKIRIVTEVLGELGKEYGGGTPMNILITEISDRYNMSEEKVEEILRILKRKGIIFELQQGYLKIV